MELKEQLETHGYGIVKKLLNDKECDELVKVAYDLSLKLLLQTNNVFIFSSKTEAQLSEEFFLNSNDQIRPFLEEGAIGKDGKILGDLKFSLNKIGHALHYLHPIFRGYTYSDKVLAITKELGLVEPAVVQSMVVFKNPKVSSEVQPHQDGCYLFTEPIPVVGFWIALEDATTDNGCLWIVKGSHKTGIHRRLKRSPDLNAKVKLDYDCPIRVYPDSDFIPVPVSKGDCIILHGHVVHKSGMNTTNKARPAYTFHVIEKKDNVYSPDNWLHESKAAPFVDMHAFKNAV